MKILQRLIILGALFGVLLVPSSAQTWGVLTMGGVMTTAIETVTTPIIIASGSTIIDGGFCAIPRYHLVFNPSTTTTLYTVFGRTDAAGCSYYSTNSGTTWAALGASTFKQDYHTGIDVDTSGRVFLGGRHDDEMGVPYSRRYHIDHWDSEIVWDDHTTTNATDFHTVATASADSEAVIVAAYNLYHLGRTFVAGTTSQQFTLRGASAGTDTQAEDAILTTSGNKSSQMTITGDISNAVAIHVIFK